MRRYWLRLVRSLKGVLEQWGKPATDELVSSLILNMSSVELPKGQYIQFAPMKGCCGPFKASGNSLPVFEYKVFEKKLMEFIHIRVEVGKPDRIDFIGTIDSKGHTENSRHGESVEVTEKYKLPFFKLAVKLFDYFPYYGMPHVFSRVVVPENEKITFQSKHGPIEIKADPTIPMGDFRVEL